MADVGERLNRLASIDDMRLVGRSAAEVGSMFEEMAVACEQWEVPSRAELVVHPHGGGSANRRRSHATHGIHESPWGQSGER